MPDLMTHMTAAYLVKRVTFPRKNVFAFVAGATLPDLVSYVPLFISAAFVSLQRSGLLNLPGTFHWFFDLHYLFAPFHGFVPFFLLCWILVLFFPEEERRGILVNLVLGSGLHLLLDLAQESHTPTGYLLFPLSTKSFSLDWFGSESSLHVAPFLMAVAAGVLVRDRIRGRRAGRGAGSEGPGIRPA